MGLVMFLIVAGIVGGFAFYMLKKQKDNNANSNVFTDEDITASTDNKNDPST